MPRHHAPQQKGWSKVGSNSDPNSELLASRPFATPTQSEANERSPENSVPERSPATLSLVNPDGGRSLPIQPKLTIGAPNDKYEQEADRVAQQVVQQINVAGKGQSASGKTASTQANQSVQRETLPEEDELQMKPLADQVQRVEMPEEEELQMKPLVQRQGGGAIAASEDLETAIQQSRGGGQPLAESVRQPMEQAFGDVDFSGVKVHTDGRSDQLNRSIQAKAFTTGQDIFFRQGAYQPGHPGGQELLAHELTHVVQQHGKTVQRSPSTTQSPNLKDQPSLSRDRDGTIRGQWTLGKRHATAAKRAKALGPTTPKDESQVLDALETGVTASGVSTTTSDEYGVAKTRGHTALDSTQDKSLGVAGGTTDFISMFTGIASAIKAFQKDEASSGDKAGAVLSGIHAGMSGAKGTSAVVDKSAQLAKSNDTGIGESLKAAGTISGLTDSFGVIKETFFAVKEIIDLAKDAQGMSSEEKFRAAMSVIKHLLEGVKSGLSAAKSFWDTWGGGAAGPLIQSIPGLGIALGCVDLIIRGVALVTAEVHKFDMRGKKRELKEKFGGKKGTSSKAEAERILKNPASTPEEKADAEEYLLAKGLQYINQKRSNRAILKISVTMAKIAGDATTLGGVSAPVGLGLKVGAMGVDVGASAFRNIKQMGRDKADKSAADSTWRTIFNADKSTQKKLVEYNKTIDQVFVMIIKADALTGPNRETGMQRCSDYIGAMGFSIAQMHRYRTTPDQLREKMIEALKQRE